jgi:hypothetical protein
VIRAAALVVAGLVAVPLLAGCSSNDTPSADPDPGPPPTLQPAVGSPPSGTTRFSCDVAAASGPVTLALDLPDSFRPGRDGKRGCAWRKRVAMHDSDIPYSIDVVVSVRSVGEDASLEDVYTDQEPNEVEGDTPEGDDSILDLVLEQDVPALGPTLGDRLSWRCYCDGQDLITRMAQADGVRVTWSSVVALTKETDAAFARAVEGAGTV